MSLGDRAAGGEARSTLAGFELSRPAEPQTIPVFRHRAAAFAAERGAGPDLVHDVVLAVSEATTNAVKHAYEAEKPGSVELSASAEDGWLTLRIGDRGGGFGEGSSDGLGLGLVIVAGLCDDLKIIQEGAGTQVVMRFVLR
jgi:serine/threonine-protein kinase RsbW